MPLPRSDMEQLAVTRSPIEPQDDLIDIGLLAINHAMTKGWGGHVMDEHAGERHFCKIEAVRKGRGQSPCFLKVGVSLDTDGQVILRAHDQSGVASLVALLSSDQALELAEALMYSAEAAVAVSRPAASLSRRPPIASADEAGRDRAVSQ